MRSERSNAADSRSCRDSLLVVCEPVHQVAHFVAVPDQWSLVTYTVKSCRSWLHRMSTDLAGWERLVVTASTDSGPRAAAGVERNLLERLGAVVFQTDAQGNWTYLNRAWTDITGYPREETLGTNFLEYVHPDERDYTVALFMAVVEGAADSCHHETRYRTRSGAYRWLELRATLLYDDEGKLVGNCGTLVDITSRRAATRSIDERVQLTELVVGGESFDDLPFGAVLLDHDLVVKQASPTARRLLGHPLPAGTRFDDLLPQLDVRDARVAR